MPIELYKYAEDDPRFVYCRAMKIMDVHNSRAVDIANNRVRRYNEQIRAMAIRPVVPVEDAAVRLSFPDSIKRLFEGFRQSHGRVKMLSFRLKVGRLVIELQRAERSE